MKILHVKEDVNIQYVCWYMSITKLIGDTHKRYWISEYSKLHIPIPPRKEQDRIINKVNELFLILECCLILCGIDSLLRLFAAVHLVEEL